VNWQTKQVKDWLEESIYFDRYGIDVNKLTVLELEKEVKQLLVTRGRVVQTAAMDYLKNQAVKQLLKEVEWEEVVKALQKEDKT
jgi:hypothetical protein